MVPGLQSVFLFALPLAVPLPLVCCVLSGMSWALLGLAYKVAEQQRCRVTAFALVFMLIAGVFSFGKVFTETTHWGDLRLWLLGIAMGAMIYGGIRVVMRAYTLGPGTIVWTVVGVSLLVPIGLASAFLGERFLWIDAVLLLLFLLMLLAFAQGMSTSGETAHGKLPVFLLMLALVFFINGLFMFGSKVKEFFFGNDNSAALSMIFYLSGVVIAVLVDLIREKRVVITAREWMVGTFAGVTSVLGMLLFLASMKLPSIVAFPVSQGISLLGGVVLTAVIYRERLTFFKTLGLALGIAVFLTAAFREPLATWVQTTMLHAGL